MRMSAEKEAYNYIRQAIISKKLLPNEQIVEQNIVNQTGISRTPVRSALKTLSNEGLIVLRPNRGAFVTNPSHQEVRDLYECKLMLEIETAMLACAYVTNEDITNMRGLLSEAIEDHRKCVYERFLDLNYRFHMIIASASHNKILEKYNHELLMRSNAALLVYDDFREVPVEDMESFREHRAIVDALCARDKGAVQRAMHRHITNTYDTFRLSLPLRYEYKLS